MIARTAVPAEVLTFLGRTATGGGVAILVGATPPLSRPPLEVAHLPKPRRSPCRR
jgi:hypothetical protein